MLNSIYFPKRMLISDVSHGLVIFMQIVNQKKQNIVSFRLFLYHFEQIMNSKVKTADKFSRLIPEPNNKHINIHEQ